MIVVVMGNNVGYGGEGVVMLKWWRRRYLWL